MSNVFPLNANSREHLGGRGGERPTNPRKKKKRDDQWRREQQGFFVSRAIEGFGGGNIGVAQSYMLSPRIISGTVGITPLTVIFALIVGGELFGLPGLIVAVPIDGILRVIIKNVRPSETMTNAEVRPGLTHAPRDRVEGSATSTG